MWEFVCSGRTFVAYEHRGAGLRVTATYITTVTYYENTEQ